MKAALFDFDGVLFDTIDAHEVCWKKVGLQLNKPISREQFLQGFGVKNAFFVQHILQWAEDPAEIEAILQKKESFFEEYIAEIPMKPILGTIDLVARLVEAGIPCVIGSSSIRKNIDLILRHYLDIASFFTGIISGEDVTHGKPDPMVFLKAAHLVQCPPEKAVVFEDAPLGIEAAKRANMVAVALTTTFSESILQKSKPDLIVSSGFSVAFSVLQQLVAQKGKSLLL